jgi:hypothetical protein
MNKLIERTLIGIILLIAAGIVVHAPLTVWLGMIWPQWTEVMKAWKELLMALGLVLLVVAAVRRRKFDVLMSDLVMQLALIYAGLYFVLIGLFENGLHAAGAGLLIDLRYVLYFVLVYGTLRLFPAWRSLFVKVIIGGAVVVIVFGLLQMSVLPKDILAHIGYGSSTIQPYLTVDKNPDYVRINSTLRGPNPLGAYVVIVLSLIVAYALRYGRKLQQNQWLLLALAAIATGFVLGATYSRSSVIGLVVAIGILLVAATTGKVRRRLVASVLSVVIVCSVVVLAFYNTPTVSNIILHVNPTGGSSTDSNQGHAESLADGAKRFVVQPFGAGVGSTGSASLRTNNSITVENQYLFIAHESGWIGLVIFLWLFIEVMHRLWHRRSSALALGTLAAGWGLAFIGLLLPVWADDTVSIIWWGLAAAAIATAKRKGEKR